MPEKQSTYVKKRIDELRNKLLDLGLRNKLIQFRHNARHKTYARLVDASPDQILIVCALKKKNVRFADYPYRSNTKTKKPKSFKKHSKPPNGRMKNT
jgi:hypothetical protein